MNHDEQKQELSRLVGDTLEHLRYLRELGVEQFGETDAQAATETRARAPQTESRAPQQVSALRRNAAAHDRSTPDANTSSTPTATSTHA